MSPYPMRRRYTGGMCVVLWGKLSAHWFRELIAHQDDIAFHHKLVPTITRSVRLTNTLPFAIAIWNASVVGDARNAFEV